ncbi:MAG: hypothetical protein OSJ45_12640 [Lachnospiraceae bacterium]|nr:hypothetical protein [Lachnospiraceae bacterium]
MYSEDLRNGYGREDTSSLPQQSRSEKILEARRAFASGGSSHNYGCQGSYKDEYLVTNEKKHPFGLIRIMAAGMLFLILGIAFYNNFSYNGFDKDYVLECLERSGYWDKIVEGAGDITNKVTGWYNSLGH